MATKPQRRVTREGAKKATTNVPTVYDEQFIEPLRREVVKARVATRWIWLAIIAAWAVGMAGIVL